MSTYRIPFAIPAWTYDEALGRLHQALHFGIDPKIETVEEMLAEAGDPDLAFTALQIAGTNGKTSTSRYTAAILAGEGLRVALYTSPELVRYTERMEVGGRPVDDAAFARGIAAASVAGQRVNERREAAGERPYDITEFDLLTVGACIAFAEAGVDVAVLEVGMGGRWDATSAVRSIGSVSVTGIGLDHMRILGDTLEAIAAEKAAVIKRGRSCMLGTGVATPASVEDVFLRQCAEQDVVPTILRATNVDDVAGEMHPGVPREHPVLPRAGFVVTDRPRRIGDALEIAVDTPHAHYEGLRAIKPAYQATNIACAVALTEEYLGRALEVEKLRDSILHCPTPGRFDVVRTEPIGIIDACHNPQSVETFLTAVKAIGPELEGRPALLCAALADKDVASMVELLAPEFADVYVTQTSSPRALAAVDLAAIFEKAGAEVRGCYPTVGEALAALANTPFIACGSITLAGEVAGLLRP